MKQQALIDGIRIRDDFQSLADNFCSCPKPALRKVVFATGIVDITRMARRFRDPVVVGLEIIEKGSRLFMAAHRDHIFHYLCHLRMNRPEHSTWHEIMSHLTRMRLYFDLEYHYETNPDISQDDMMVEFRETMLQAVCNYFQFDNVENHLRLVELDASTNEKFSRHMIVHIRDHDGREIGFKNSKDLMNFVQGPISRALTRGGFYVRPLTDFQNSAPLIDMACYQEKSGANFRLLGSPKYGRDNVMKFVYDSQFGGNKRHEFRFHDPKCIECNRIFDDSLVNISNSTDQSITDDDLMPSRNVESYRHVIDSSSIDIDRFGLRCALYYEIDLFNSTTQFFGSRIMDDLLALVSKYSQQSAFYEDLKNEKKIIDLVRFFGDFKTTMRTDPIDWDTLYGVAGDLLDIFYIPLEEESMKSILIPSDFCEKIRDYSRKSAARRRTKEVRTKYFKLLELSSSTVDDWAAKKKQIIQQKFETKLERLGRCVEEEKKFQQSIRSKLEQSEKIGEKIRRGVEKAIGHSRVIIEDFERRMKALEEVDAYERDRVDEDFMQRK